MIDQNCDIDISLRSSSQENQETIESPEGIDLKSRYDAQSLKSENYKGQII